MNLPARPMVLATAWWICAELVRRHPERLRVIETHPGGGQYDCVSIFDISSPDGRLIAHLNLTGHLTPESWFRLNTRRPSWKAIATSPNRRKRVIEALERSEGLEAPVSTPSATPSSLAIRAIAAFLERCTLATRPRWEMANGYYDSSLGCQEREDCFSALPLVAAHRAANHESFMLGIPEYRYWFLTEVRDDTAPRPRMAFDQVDGLAWDRERTYDLIGLYRGNGRSLDRLVSDVFPPAF